ncbi:uracil-DNA glycosylase [Facklamia sp. HMSC062C11]|uniref:uracil-DNA glycosylase n=1 Tax=Facklamia sp. HMSC062C11 TaxID=1739262 RepID=UPI0008A39C17|nr:uracil-DNA glycosylase [Facklamia sp. HMSC062C11]OFL65149.1 uracil-DNA glycosylase [Facklamia sp. HMSC062C11]
MYQLANFSAVASDWAKAIEAYYDLKQLDHIENQLLELGKQQKIYPPSHQVYQALTLTPFSQVRVVIIGQDPYHGPDQANGLAFSVNPGQKLPPSLRNIFQELAQDLGHPLRQSGDLSDWAKQGVLLLNRTLTVAKGQANSHQGLGWKALTRAIVQSLNQADPGIVFLLWGKPAQALISDIDQTKHRIITSSHPSPLSAYRSFFGSRPFSRVNHYLIQQGKKPIQW